MGADNHPSSRVVVIAGPTASGKSAVALTLAERCGGVVINADAMQVYRDLRILTARPRDPDLARAPHRLFGHVEAADAYSVGRWLSDLQQALQEAQAEHRRPIIVGGTGLYLRALTQGLSDIPMVPPDVRARVRADAEGRRPIELHAELNRRDPAMAARLRPSDPQRIVRALEVLEATGRSLAAFQGRRSAPVLDQHQVVAVRLDPDRDVLRAQIDRRFDLMIADGALTEVRQLAEKGLAPELPAMKALGLPPLLAHLEGQLSLDEAVARSKHLTRSYAKRQMTFARHQLPFFETVSPNKAFGTLIRRLG